MRRPTRHDLLDHLHQVRIVVERHVGEFELPVALDVHLLVRVDENVRDARIAQQRFERAEPEHLVVDVDRQLTSLDVVRRQLILVENARDQRRDFLPDLLLRQAGQALQLDSLEHGCMNLAAQLLISLAHHGSVRSVLVGARREDRRPLQRHLFAQ